MNEIKFVYFDVGGVIIKDFSDSDKWKQMLIDWKIPSKRFEEAGKRYKEFEKEVCVGRDVEEFLVILKNDFGVEIPDNYSLQLGFIDRFEKNERMWEIVSGCQKSFKIGLLTNMYPGALEIINKRNLIPKNCWEIVIDSSIVQCKKPEKEIYEIAQKRCGMKPGEILFIDNKEKNLVEPRNMGWKTFLYNSADYEKSNKELGIFLANKVEF